MEQRNGRIDRHGQERTPHCLHFHYLGNADSEFLQVAVLKVNQMRTDLGSVGEVIAKSIEDSMLGKTKALGILDKARQKVRDELKAELLTQERVRQLQRELREAREQWNLRPDVLRGVVEEALQLLGHPGLQDIGDGLYRLTQIPAPWREVRPWVSDGEGRLKPLTFDHRKARRLEGAELIHLEHPLMRRALALFRANIWSEGLHKSQQLARVSYRVVSSGDLVTLGERGQKLHEEVALLGGEFRVQQFTPLTEDELKRGLEYDHHFPAIPLEVARSLQGFYPAHRRALEEQAQRLRDVRGAKIEGLLKAHAEAEGKALQAMVTERRKEVEQRLKDLDKYYSAQQQALFEPDVVEQFKNDVGLLRDRLEKLRVSERDGAERRQAAERYRVKTTHVFPLALVYLLPDSLTGGGA